MKRLLSIAATLVVAVVIGLAIATRHDAKRGRFNSAEWRSSGGGTCASARRDEMARDLIDHVLTRGMRPEHVHRLLGTPYAKMERSGTRGEWWPTGWDGEDCSVLSVWYRNGRLTDASRPPAPR